MLNSEQNVFTRRLRLIELLSRSTVTHRLSFHVLPKVQVLMEHREQ